MRRKAILGLVLAACCVGCGNQWATRRAAADTLYAASTLAYGLIQAQAATGTIPGAMTPEQFQAEVAKANAAFPLAQAAYAQASVAVEAQDGAGYSAAMTQLATQAAIILSVKAAVCPVIHKEKKNG